MGTMIATAVDVDDSESDAGLTCGEGVADAVPVKAPLDAVTVPISQTAGTATPPLPEADGRTATAAMLPSNGPTGGTGHTTVHMSSGITGTEMTLDGFADPSTTSPPVVPFG